MILCFNKVNKCVLIDAKLFVMLLYYLGIQIIE
jgi:hypothetical protein